MERTGDLAHYDTSDYLRRAKAIRLRHAAGLVMARRSEPAHTRRMNDELLEWAARSGGRFFAICSVHPYDGATALTEIDRVARRGARGLKLHPNTQQFDVGEARVKRVVARAAERGLPVLFDAYSPFDADQSGKFLRLAMEVPTGRIILAHAHGPRFPELLVYEVLARYSWWKRNVWVDLSAIAPLLARSPFTDQFVWVLRKVGVDRLLFGSDYPMDDPADAVKAVATMGFSARELSRIFFRNARELFGL